MAQTMSEERSEMLERQIRARGVRDPRVLAAMLAVERERFIPAHLREFAYRDTPLPIERDQTISQPYIVAAMTEALELGPGDRVLEVGTGSGYAAAVLAEIAREVYTIERYELLATTATRRLGDAGYSNVHVRHGDGTLGWPERAPFDAIVVAAGSPQLPPSLIEQLAPGGRLVIPVGTGRAQRLLRVRRDESGAITEENLGGVRFVPLVGAEGWSDPEPEVTRSRAPSRRGDVASRVAVVAEPFDSIDDLDTGALIERIGDARVVLLGEATHGTSEFYRARTAITRALVERAGFDVVAVEADWPDAARIDAYVRDFDRPDPGWVAFSRFPQWMWRNREAMELYAWMRLHNAGRPVYDRCGFYGLDLYSLHTSIDQVLEFLDAVDPESAEVARERYGCLSPWQADPAAYGRAALSGRYRECEEQVVAMLEDLLDKRIAYGVNDGERLLDALQNARLVVDAERYYRAMYYGSTVSWNLRDSHMFDTLQAVLRFRGPTSRAVIWAHNSHIGDASATEMAARGEHNLGQLCRAEYGHAAYLIGFGTHAGTVAAARGWGRAAEIMQVRPSHDRSYERVFHRSGVPRFCLPLRGPSDVRGDLASPRLQRAIGVVYRPEFELASHYFSAVLPRQLDELIWFDETEAVTPLSTDRPGTARGAETFPFGL